MNEKIVMASVLCLAALWSGRAETGYAYAPSDSKIYIATVPAGETNAISSAAAAVLNGGGVTNFVKRGEGVFVSNLDITSYTGGIVVEDGIFRSEPNVQANDTVGKLTGGGEIWVKDGATMEIHSPGMYSTHMTGKTTHIAGRGFGGRGALVACADNKNQVGATFGSTVILEADALVCNESSAYFYLAVKSCTLNFNQHTLYVGGTKEVGFDNVPTFSNMPNPGTAIVSEGYGVKFERSSANTYNLWHTYCGLVFTNSSRLVFSGVFVNNFSWPMTFHQGCGIHVVGSGNTWSPSTSYNQITANATLNLLDPDRNWIQLNNATDHLSIKGKISGGGLRVNTYTEGSELSLHHAQNSFTNGVVVSKCLLHLLANGALPAAGKALSLTNAAVAFHSSQTYSLPSFEAYGNCAVSNYTGFSAGGAWRESVVKSGTGTLRYASLIGAPLLDVRGGTVAVEPVGGELPAFGELAGADGGTVDLGGNAYSVADISGSPVVANCPTLSVTNSCKFDASGAVGAPGLVTSGSLAFGAEATVSVSNPEVIAAGRRSRQWTLATASGGISGSPSVVCAVPGWTLAKSADGRMLTLKSPVVGFKMIVR